MIKAKKIQIAGEVWKRVKDEWHLIESEHEEDIGSTYSIDQFETYVGSFGKDAIEKIW